MRHDTTIPNGFHDGAVSSVKGALGAFWSSVFRDQELVDALLAARVLAAGQLYVDVMEALSLRDHAGSPVFHREHWHPLVIRLSQRNKASVMTVGMPDTPVVGAQPSSGSVYLPDEVFVVGGNPLYSKVNTYPIERPDSRPLVKVATALCDSIASPRHVLSQGRDFSIERGVLAVRKEQDPFDSDGYLVLDDGDDKVAVLWACDAELDNDNVSDFLGYPLGLYAPSTETASGALSALWDAVTLGLTPITLNKVLGAVFDVPVVACDTTVEAITDDGDDCLVVTDDRVYCIEKSRLSDRVRASVGATLKKGTFLTDEIAVHWGVSATDLEQLRADARLVRVSLPPGSVAGVDEAVVIAAGDRGRESGGWFKLSDGDTADSPFWRAVFSRTTEPERNALYDRLRGDNATVDPLRDIGPVVLANMILVYTTRLPAAGSCAELVLPFLGRLVPSFASLLVVLDVQADETGADAMTMADDATAQRVRYNSSTFFSSTMDAAGDSVSFMFVPSTPTEV